MEYPDLAWAPRPGRISSVRREDGDVIYYAYDEADRLTGEQWYDEQMTPLYAFQWDYDAAGNRTYESRDGQETYYTYDAGNQLTTTQGPAGWSYFSYDADGNCMECHGRGAYFIGPCQKCCTKLYVLGSTEWCECVDACEKARGQNHPLTDRRIA